jgi:hypothetical protein
VFTLVQMGANGPHNTTTWTVVAPDPGATSAPVGSVIVVEEAEVTEHFDDYETWRRVVCWFAPKLLVASPTALVGLDREGVEARLFSRGARRIRVASERVGALAFRSVPTASVDARVRDRAAAIASFVAERVGVEVVETGSTAGYCYVEVHAHNMNETIGNSWSWRLVSRVRFNDGSGVLTVELSASDVDAREVDGANSLEDRAKVWLALPASEVEASVAAPGVRLQDVSLNALTGEVLLVRSHRIIN